MAYDDEITMAKNEAATDASERERLYNVTFTWVVGPLAGLETYPEKERPSIVMENLIALLNSGKPDDFAEGLEYEYIYEGAEESDELAIQFRHGAYRAAVDALVTKYGLQAAEPHGNETKAWEGVIAPLAHIRVSWIKPCISSFDPLICVDVAFGEVRHVWENRTHIGEHGLAFATAEIKERHDPNDPVGSALLGNATEGFKWRVGAVAPKSRTSVGAVGDYYAQTSDIVMHLLALAPVVVNARGNPGWSYGEWTNAQKGW